MVEGAECAVVEGLAGVIDEFGECRYLEILADEIDNPLICVGEARCKDVIHDVGIMYADGGMGPRVGQVDGGLGQGKIVAEAG